VLRYVVGPIQTMTDGRVDAGMLRPALVGLAMVVTMLMRPQGLWPAPDATSRRHPDRA
jgi:branched-chain amino acid transport system permease protein